MKLSLLLSTILASSMLVGCWNDTSRAPVIERYIESVTSTKDMAGTDIYICESNILVMDDAGAATTQYSIYREDLVYDPRFYPKKSASYDRFSPYCKDYMTRVGRFHLRITKNGLTTNVSNPYMRENRFSTEDKVVLLSALKFAREARVALRELNEELTSNSPQSTWK